MRLPTFVAATGIGIIPATFAFAFVGAGLDSVIRAQGAIYNACLAAGRTDCRVDFDVKAAVTPELLAALAALGVIALIPVVVKRLRARRVAKFVRAESGAGEGRDMAELITPDICVIGAGSGGLSVAAAAAAFGVPVVLVEKGKMGGECLNSGCVPSKALIAAARRAHDVAGAGALRHHGGARRRSISRACTITCTASSPPSRRTIPRQRFTGLGVRVIEGEARFKDKDTVAVGDDIEIKARRVRDRDRLVAGDPADPRARTRCRSSPTRPCSI